MVERPDDCERVVLVHNHFHSDDAQDLLEFQVLAKSAGAEIVGLVTGTRRIPEPRFLVGSGKADEIRDCVQALSADLVIFNHVLTPAQERNLERHIKCRVVDRTGLILDIFAQRARSFEGKLQVELAHLKHQSTRLVRGWTHLERQRGGIGLRGGPGETQLEVDRRLLRNRIKQITERLGKLRRQRALSRQSRRKAIMPTVALVGYTNAGKSTLFNKLTGASVYVADQLFATLDPTLRRVEFPEYGPIILADTVGFIRHLPHDLVEAFHATLEEVNEANLLLHVIDASDTNKEQYIEQVHKVLTAIGADTVPSLYVYNKIDQVETLTAGLMRDELGQIRRIYLSAQTGAGLDALALAMGESLGRELVHQTVILKPEQGKLRAQLFARNAVLSEKIDEMGLHHLEILLPQIDFEKLFR